MFEFFQFTRIDSDFLSFLLEHMVKIHYMSENLNNTRLDFVSMGIPCLAYIFIKSHLGPSTDLVNKPQLY